MCRVLGISRSGYYDWQKVSPGKRELANQGLDQRIEEVYRQHKQRYGAPRITKALKARGEPCSHTRVARRMRALGLKALVKRKFKVTTDSSHNQPTYSNVLNRDFSTTGINQKWAQDITYVRTDEGWLYLAVVIDLYSRAVIGWSMNSRMKKSLVCNALTMALFKRRFPKEVIVHSDRGSQYCSKAYRTMINHHGLMGSMSRKGNYWDNSIAKSFFHTLKVELVHESRYKTREEARQSLFQYIETYYNQQRLHSAIDYKVPNEVEYAA